MKIAIDFAGMTTLDRLSSTDEGRSGAKAFNCARLKQAGFRVPDGLVVKADATEADIGRPPSGCAPASACVSTP